MITSMTLVFQLLNIAGRKDTPLMLSVLTRSTASRRPHVPCIIVFTGSINTIPLRHLRLHSDEVQKIPRVATGSHSQYYVLLV